MTTRTFQGIIQTAMNKLVIFLLTLVSAFAVLSHLPVHAEEINVDTGTVLAVDEPILYEEEGSRYYTQRALVRIDSGYYKNIESETVYTFPKPGMRKAVEVGDRVELTYDVQNAAQPLQILNFERRSVLAIVPLIIMLAIAAIFIRKKLDFVYILFVIICPLATFAAIQYAKLPPVPSAIAVASILGTVALLLQYSKLIPAIAALLSFVLSYGIGALVIHAVSNTLKIFTGIFEPLLAYTGIPLPDNLSSIITAGLLVIPFAAILAIVLSVVNRVIKARAQQGEGSKAELIKLGIVEGLAASKDAVFSFLSLALGFLIPIVVSLAGTQALLEILNSEVFSFLILLGIAPIFMCLIAIFTSALVSGLLLGTAMPHRLISEREAKELLENTPQDHLPLSKEEDQEKPTTNP